MPRDDTATLDALRKDLDDDDLTGMTVDGRRWGATWKSYRAFTSHVPNDDRQQPEWIVTVDGKVVGGITQFGLGAPLMLIEEAVRDVLDENGITVA